MDITNITLLKNFYVRRILRIFPIYYLTLFILLIGHKNTGVDIKTALPYFVTYTTNFYFFHLQHWYGMASHLWSLAVEEQFYLFWPGVLLFTPKKYVLAVIIAFICAGECSNLLTHDLKLNGILTTNCLHFFGFGALLAWFSTYADNKLPTFFRVATVAASLAVLVFFIGVYSDSPALLLLLLRRTTMALLTVWLLCYLIMNEKSRRFGFILNNPILIFLGKISYGIYLYHNIIPILLNKNIIDKYLNPLLPNIIYKDHWRELFVIENTILLISLSWLSYVLIETPFLRLKHYFEPSLKLENTTKNEGK